MTDNPAPTESATSAEMNTASAIGDAFDENDATAGHLAHDTTAGAQANGDDLEKVSAQYIWLIVLAQFGSFLALVAPLGYSLSVQLTRVAPGNETSLGYITGIGALMVVLLGPIAGMLSDRTRTRIGRRRPWLIALTIVGLVGLAVCAFSSSFAMLFIGWIIVTIGLGVGGLQLTNSLADRLPDSQRGKVSGLSGVATMIASVMGTAIAAALAFNSILLFLVPGVIGAALIFVFVIVIKEPDTRTTEPAPKTRAIELLKSYGYNVRKYADFSWNWLGRFMFNFGLTLATTFTTYFFGSKLGLAPDKLGGIVVIAGLLGVIATAGGAAAGGWLSDKIARRRMPLLISALLFAAGGVLMAFAPGLTVILVGSALANLGLGVFSAVDQAIYLSVLPERQTQSGRYVAINQFSTSIPQTIAPLLAPSILLIGGTAAVGNYFLLYLVAAGAALIGGNIIFFTVKSVR
ncbi:MFS transporter [Humibacter antri]